MTVTYNLGNDIGKVRRLINDVDSTLAIFQDDEITFFLELEGGVRRAAALGLETIARNELYILKVIELMDLKTDGAAVAREMRLQAAELRRQAADADASEEEGAGFDVAEWVVGPFSARERLWNEALRGG